MKLRHPKIPRHTIHLFILAALTMAWLITSQRTALADQYGTVTTVSVVRALSNGSIHIWFNDMLGPGVCSKRLIASEKKEHNERIAEIALAALLAEKNVKVEFESSTCELQWLEIRAE